MYKKILVLFVIICISFNAFNQNISIECQSDEYYVGEQIEVQVLIENIQSLSGYQFAVNFDNNKIITQSVEEGSFLQSYSTFWDDSGFNDYTSVLLPVSCIKEFDNTGVTGDGLLVTIFFEAINPGQAIIYFSNIILVNSDGNQISLTYQNKEIEILQNQVSLSNGSVSPPSGTTEDNFEFSVIYTDASNNPPNSVTVHGTGWTHNMAANGNNWEDGVEFTFTGTVASLGIVEYYYEAETNAGEMLRYPETGYLELNVTQSATGWSIMAYDLDLDPTNMTSGGDVNCTGDIFNDCWNNTYTNLQYKFEMFNPSGNLIDEVSGSLSSISSRTHIDVTATLTTQNSNGLYNVVFSIMPQLDENPLDNSVSAPVIIGETGTDNQFYVPADDAWVEMIPNNIYEDNTHEFYHTGCPSPVNKYKLLSANNDEIAISLNGGSYEEIDEDDFEEFYSGQEIVIYEEYIGSYVAVSFGYLRSDYLDFQGVTHISGLPGEDVVFTAYCVEDLEDDAEIYDNNDVEDWDLEIDVFNGGNWVYYEFGIPNNANPGKEVFYLASEFDNANGSKFLARLEITVLQSLPNISTVSSNSFSADDIITISGSNFNTSGIVKFGTIAATTINSWTSTSISCVVPEGIQDANIMVITNGGASNGMPYQVISSTGDPEVVQPVPDQSMDGGATLLAADFNNVFMDPNGDDLVFDVQYTSSNLTHNSDFASTGLLYLTAAEYTTETVLVTISATDDDNVTVNDEFDISISSPLPTYTISGTILEADNTPTEGVTITFSDAGGNTTTDANGDYSITVDEDYSGTATPSKSNWTFAPVSTPYVNVSSNYTDQDYVGTRPTYTISGTILKVDNIAVDGVTIIFSDGGGSTTTDANGNYSITVDEGYSGTATPTKIDWTFEPTSIPYVNVSSDYTEQDYIGTPPTYTISGTILEADNTAVDGVTVTFSNGGGSTTTNSSGYYTKTVAQGYSGSATPSKSGWTFSPASKPYSSVSSDYSNENYTGTPPAVTYNISGYIRESNNTPIDGVTVTFSNGGGSTTTNSSGYYTKTVAQGYSGTVTPTKTGRTFSPTSKSYTSVSSNYSNENYTGAPQGVTYTISGYIRESNNIPVDGVTVTFSNGGGSTTTNSSGYYTTTVSQGYSGTATPSKSGWTFSPTSKSYNSVSYDYSNENYTGYTALPITLPWTEDWESITTSSYTSDVSSIAGAPEWSYDMVDEGGRLRFEAGSNYYHNGSKAATLDKNPNGSVNTNFLIAELDLSNYISSTNIVISFYYMQHGEESNDNDRVWVRGSSSDDWVEIYNLYTNQGSNGNWNHVVDLDIDDILFTAVPQQTISSTFQIRFGQQDNYPSTSTTASDGYTFDDIVVAEESNNGSGLSQDLQHYYKLDGNLEDCIGTVHGTNSNTIDEPNGLINNARDFSGATNCYIETNNNSSFNYLHNGSNFTISIWEKHNTGVDDSYVMMGNDIGGDRIGIFFSVYGDDVRYQVGRYPAPYPAASLNWENVLVPNTTQWNHLVVTYNNLLSSNQYTLYVNGQLAETGDRTNPCVTGNSFYSMKFGINKLSGTKQPFNGDLDEIAFWDRKLESNEVADLYNNGAGLQHPFSITLPSLLDIQDVTISNGETECYNATNTITVAGSGTTVDVNPGGEATFIAGNKIIFNPGFTAHLGSYSNAYITLTGEYCNQQQSMMAANSVINEDGGTKALNIDALDDASDELVVNIYPNPTTGNFTIDFMGKETTADITVLNFQGNKIRSLECYNQVQAEVDISYLPAGMYIVIIKTETEIIKKKVTMLR